MDATEARAPTVPRTLTFPPRHTLHKYWGKKPANVVAAYIQQYAPEEATVLDPFSGSGIVLGEALIAGRRAVAADVNPVANLITRVTAEAVDPTVLRETGAALLKGLAGLRATLYAVPCGVCGTTAERVSTAYHGEHPVRVTVDCPVCGTREQSPDPAPAPSALPLAGDHPDGEIFAGWQMQKLARKGLRRWSELFTPRNLVAVSHLRRAIAGVHDPAVQRALRVSFTAHLAQSTRMIADYRGAAGGPSWKLNCYWLPARWQELNPFRYYANRVEKTARGLADMRAALGRTVHEGVDYAIHDLSAEAIGTRVPRASVGYVFTDPPYGGEGIQYGELSMLWNLWADTPVSLASEIATNPYQAKSHGQYVDRLAEAFAAVHDVLVPGGWMSVSFANKDAAVWDGFLKACRTAGFALTWVVPLTPSASNITHKVTQAAPKTDLVVTFKKPGTVGRGPVPRVTQRVFTLADCLAEEALALGATGMRFRTSELYDRVLMRWMRTAHGETPEGAAQPAYFTVLDVVDHLTRSSDHERVPDDAPGEAVWVRRG